MYHQNDEWVALIADQNWQQRFIYLRFCCICLIFSVSGLPFFLMLFVLHFIIVRQTFDFLLISDLLTKTTFILLQFMKSCVKLIKYFLEWFKGAIFSVLSSHIAFLPSSYKICCLKCAGQYLPSELIPVVQWHGMQFFLWNWQHHRWYSLFFLCMILVCVITLWWCISCSSFHREFPNAWTDPVLLLLHGGVVV